MRKRFTKIICAACALLTAFGVTAATACSDPYNGKPLQGDMFTESPAISNGGFAVGKGNYVYFINGAEENTAQNTYGSVVKGSIMRISSADLAARNYAKTDIVVPQIAYSGNKNAGIYVYGDYVYYSTPSTEKNSDGAVLNSNLAFKRTKLDGTQAMRDYYVQFPDSSFEYRYVQVDGTVYLMYVAKNEDLYGTGAKYTNIHSVNCETGENTLLAYNVVADSVAFDKTDLENPNVYYLMQVRDFKQNGTADSTYNQIYTVRADATQSPKEYDFSEIEDYDAEKDPLYVNLGKLVLDGIGWPQVSAGNVTQFNGEGAEKVTDSPLTYALSSYQNGTLFYTRTSTNDKTSRLFTLKDTAELKPVENANPDDCISTEGASASNFNYFFDNSGNLDYVIATDSKGFVKADVVDGKIVKTVDNNKKFYIPVDAQPTVLFYEGDYIYYSKGSGDGYSINRINYTGEYKDYNRHSFESDGVTEYTSVTILDLACSTDWYKPEYFNGQLLFASETKNMTEFNYIMACDLRTQSGEVMSNAEISALTEKYTEIEKSISEIDEENYKNLQNALRYGFYTGDKEYLDTLTKAYVDILGSDEERFWSKQSVEKYNDFIAARGDWSDYAETKTVNGEQVAANKQAYYYSVIGKMTENDAEKYVDNLRTTYLQAWPEKEGGWYDNLSTEAKVGFIVGVCVGGLLIIAAVTITVLVVIRKKKEKMPEYTKRRIKVDTTDDKDIDVYSDGEGENGQENG